MTGPRAQAVDAAVRQVAEAAAGTAGLVVEDVRISVAGKRRVVRIVVDLPETAIGSVPLDAVAAASQEVSARLDEDAVLGEQPYVLEVTSPGVDRPLTERRHYLRARTRLVRLERSGAAAVQGRLIDVGEDEVVLLDPALDPSAPRPDSAVQRVPWSQVTGGRMLVEFSRAWETVDPLALDDEGDLDDDPDDDLEALDDEPGEDDAAGAAARTAQEEE